MFKYLLVSILCLSGTVAFAAGGDVQNILIYFEKGLGSNFKQGTQIVRKIAEPTCTTGDIKYDGWVYAENDKSMNLNIRGDFSKYDKSYEFTGGHCPSDGLNDTTRKPYILINGLTVSFVYDGKPEICFINATLGLAYAQSLVGNNYNRLVTNQENANTRIACGDKGNNFTYEITPGGGSTIYKKGHITIYHR